MMLESHANASAVMSTVLPSSCTATPEVWQTGFVKRLQPTVACQLRSRQIPAPKPMNQFVPSRGDSTESCRVMVSALRSRYHSP